MSGDIQISPHVGELFVKYGVRRQYRSGEVLLEKGALSAQAGFLVKGQLRTFCLGPSGDEISLFYLGPGNLFGSSALVYHAKVMVSVSAISPAEVYLLAADRFWKLWQEHGYPPQDLMAHFVRRITMLSDYICCSHFLEDDKRATTRSGSRLPDSFLQSVTVRGTRLGCCIRSRILSWRQKRLRLVSAWNTRRR